MIDNKHKKKPEKIDSVVKAIIKKLDSNSNPTSDRIIEAWIEIVGDKAGLHSKPVSLRKKKLIVNVNGSTWLYQLTLIKDELLKEMKKKFSGEKIKEIQFRIGDI